MPLSSPSVVFDIKIIDFPTPTTIDLGIKEAVKESVQHLHCHSDYLLPIPTMTSTLSCRTKDTQNQRTQGGSPKGDCLQWATKQPVPQTTALAGSWAPWATRCQVSFYLTPLWGCEMLQGESMTITCYPPLCPLCPARAWHTAGVQRYPQWVEEKGSRQPEDPLTRCEEHHTP